MMRLTLRLMFFIPVMAILVGTAYGKSNSSVVVASSANPATFGASVKFTATVTPSTATGTVTFKDGTTTLGTGAISAGKATFTTTTLAVASHSITASYGGDTNLNSSVSAALAQVINKASSSVTVASSLNPSTYGSSVKFTATVTPSTATGTVTFKDGTTTLGTGAISAGKATFTTTALTVASHSITAAYGGSTNYNSSTSAVLSQTVNKANSSVTVFSSANPSALGSSVTFTAAVLPAGVTGTVTFKDGTTTLGTGSISSGTAIFSISTLALGSHSVTASYGGDASHNSSVSSVLTQTVKQPSSVALASSANPSTFTLPVTLTANITPSTATGTVTFKDGITSLGTGSLSGGHANLTTSALASGPRSLTAVYGGNSTYVSSTSPVLTQNVLAISSIAVSPQNVSLPLNSKQQYTATATLSDGSKQNVTSNATWSSSVTSVATIDATGLLSAPGQGQTSIQAVFSSANGVTSLNVTGPTFWPVGRLHTPRVGHTATLLPNGKVLIVGGQDVNQKLIASAELYDPSTGIFSLTGSTIARAYHTATLLPSGKVLIAGGTVGDGSSTSNEADLYDPATGTFALATFMMNYQSFHSATLLNNGLVLIAGGHYLIAGGGGGFSDNELYDPTANTFTTTGNFITSRQSATASLLGTGKVLVVGGIGSSGQYLASAELFDPATGTFSAAGNLSTSKLSHTATVLISGKTLVAGGSGGIGGNVATLNLGEVYDPVANTFAVAGSLTTKRFGHSAVRLDNGSVLVVGGQNSGVNTGTAELFDPVTQTFTGAGSLVTAREGHTASLLNDGTVLIVGGEDFTLIPEAEVYAITRPLASSLQVTPASAGMQVGDARQFTAVDNNGNPRADVTWSVSDATLAAVTAESSTTLTALAAGTVTLTATAGTVTAHAQVTISAAGTMAPGTALWSAPTVPGFTPLQLVQAVPNQTGADLYSVLSTSDHSQAVIQSLTVDGQQLAQTSLPAVNANSVPDSFGGVLITQYNTCDNINPVSITDLDPVTLQPVWVLTGQSKCAPLPPQMAIRSDGGTIVTSSGNTAGFPELMILDSRGLQRFGSAIPTSSYTDAFGTTLAGFSPIGAPIVDSDGNTYVEFEVRNISAFNRGANPPTVSSVLWLWKISPNNTTITATQLSSSNNANLFPGNIIPDGSGGVVATWTIAWAGDVSVPKPTHPYQGAHMSSTGTIVTYDMPMAPTQLVNDPITGLPVNPPLALGENGTAFVSYGTNITSFDLNVGAVNWNYPAAAQTTLSIIASAATNGLVAKSTAQNGIDTVLRFDSAGVATPDTLSASRIDYWAGSLWSGVSSASGNVMEYLSPIVNFANSPLFAPGMNGTAEAAQNISVVNFSQSGTGQATITSVLQKIQTALPSNNACNTWLQGSGTNQGRSGSQQIQDMLGTNLFGHGIVYRGTTPYYENGAFSGSTNPDKTPVPGIPAGAAVFTVNDIGAFFNVSDNLGQPFKVGKRGYAGNTLRAQVSILIHEVAHQITVLGFQPDNGIPKAGKSNDILVNQNCRQLIEGLN